MTFHVNDKRDHTGRTRSSRMRLPAFGERGNMSAAGFSRSVAKTLAPVENSVMPMTSPADRSDIGKSGESGGAGTKYMIA